MKRRILLAIVSLELGVGCVFGHETWLTPEKFSAAPDESITFSLTSGMEFPKLEYAIAPERVATARFRLGEEKSQLPVLARGESALRFRASFPHAGLVTAWVTLSPKALELSPAKVAEYFAEIDAPPEVRNLWAELKAKHKWRETYTKCAKTFLAIGDVRADRSWKNPVGMPLEIVPLTDPTKLQLNAKAEFRLLENGLPLAGIPVGLIADAAGKRTFATTDSEGRVTFKIVQTGPALLFAVHLRWHERAWESNFSTLTLQIGR